MNLEQTACAAEEDAKAHGFHGLAQLIKHLRQACPYDSGTREHEIFLEQAYANVPVLILASLLLHEHCQRTGRKRVLFLTRDGCVWQPIFEKLYPEYDTQTLVASRRLYSHARPEYISYFRERYRHTDSVIVDMVGVGKTLQAFAKKHLGVENPHVFVFYTYSEPTPNRVSIMSSDTDADSRPLEDLSADVVGCYVDCADGGFINADNEHPVWLADVVATSRDLAIQMIDAVPQSGPDPLALIRRLLAYTQPAEHRCRVMKYFKHVDNH